MTLAAPLLQESTSEVSFSVQQTPPPSNSCGNNWPLAQMQKIKHAGSQGSRSALSVGREVGSLCGETWKILRKCLGLPPYPHLNHPPPPATHTDLFFPQSCRGCLDLPTGETAVPRLESRILSNSANLQIIILKKKIWILLLLFMFIWFWILRYFKVTEK